MYVVYLTRYSGKKLPEFYIGSTNINKIKNGYNGSVASEKYRLIYKTEQNENKNLFKTRILSYHNTREEAFTREREIQIKYNLINNIKYMNMSIARKNGYFGGSGEKCASYNRVCVYDKNGKIIKVSKEEFHTNREEYTAIHKGRKRSQETRKRLSEAGKGKPSPNKGKSPSIETRKKLSEHNLGKTLEDTTKLKIANANINLTTAKDIEGNTFRVNKNDIRFEQGLLFGITTKKYKFIINDEEHIVRNIQRFLADNNYPNKNKIARFIDKGVITTFNHIKYSEYTNMNGIEIIKMEWLD